MRLVDRRTKVTRRVILRGSALALPGLAAGMSIAPNATWAQDAKNLPPQTMVTLARVARDIYPHDHLADSYYIIAVSSYDSAAPDVRTMLAAGCAGLDADAMQRYKVAYIAVPEEQDRVAMLKAIETTAFFNKLRSDLLVSLYNQKAVWPKFGYEGSSADKGGYIHRGFDDINWLS